MDRVAIADFLRRHRHALQPDDVGLPLRRRRRTAGLRRGGGAAPPDNSPHFYARLEQGRRAPPPPQTVDAIALAVRLPPDERDHLRRPARHQAPPPPRRR